MEIYKVVLTGGPCAGKTTALEYIDKYLNNIKIPYILVSETATDLIKEGMHFKSELLYEFQSLILEMQHEKENIAEKYAKKFFKNEDKCVIIYDRGIIDNKAYFDNHDLFNKMLKEQNISEIDELDKYDLVIDLLSLASCRQNDYNLDNFARKENLKEAQLLDKKTSNVWANHRNVRVLSSSVPLEKEMNQVIAYIDSLLNNKQKINVKKYELDNCHLPFEEYNHFPLDTIDIAEYYLNLNNGCTNVLSKRELNGYTSFILTTYKEKNGIRTILYDKKIDKNIYFELLKNNDIIQKKEKKEINFIENSQLYKISFDGEKTILEIISTKANNKVIIPNNLYLNQQQDNTIIKVRKK